MENLPGMPEGFEGEIFRLLFESAEIAKFTPQEKTKYENDMTTERDIRNQIATAREQGVEEGIEIGMEKGVASERARLEAKLREKGYPEEAIAELMKES